MMCPPDHKHGETVTCYWHGCRCEPCVLKRREENRRQRHRRKLEGPRFTRRDEMRHLAEYGFEPHLIADMFGMHPSEVRRALT